MADVPSGHGPSGPARPAAAVAHHAEQYRPGRLTDVFRPPGSVGAPVVLSTLSRLYGRSGITNWVNPPCNVVISNVPGPPVPLFCAEAKVSALYPVSIPAHGVALNLTVQSYVDHLDFGLTADRRAVPDIDVLADYLAESFNELAAAISPPAPAVAPEVPADPAVVPIRKQRAQA